MASKNIKRIQQALKDKGCNPGPVDGVWGRNTIAAVREFQARMHLTVDGVVGPETTAALFANSTSTTPTVSVPLPWFEEARHLLGTKEMLGPGNNPVILEWAQDLDIHYPGDDIAWCGLFVAHCIGLTLPEELLPGNPLGARQWQRYGDKTTPRFGSVMVFWRESRSSGKGHVGFYTGEDETAYQILGGNQSDKVSLAWVSKDRFLSARWPKTASSLTSMPVQKRRGEGLSVNEG